MIEIYRSPSRGFKMSRADELALVFGAKLLLHTIRTFSNEGFGARKLTFGTVRPFLCKIHTRKPVYHASSLIGSRVM